MRYVKMTPASCGQGRADLMQQLKASLKQNGHVTQEVMTALAGQTGLTLNEIYGVSSFYAFLPVKPVGKNIIKVCRCVPCEMQDLQEVIESIRKEIVIEPGQTTPDGKFTLELVNCIGACDQAPAMLINDQLYGNLTAEKIAGILNSY